MSELSVGVVWQVWALDWIPALSGSSYVHVLSGVVQLNYGSLC